MHEKLSSVQPLSFLSASFYVPSSQGQGTHKHPSRLIRVMLLLRLSVHFPKIPNTKNLKSWLL